MPILRQHSLWSVLIKLLFAIWQNYFITDNFRSIKVTMENWIKIVHIFFSGHYFATWSHRWWHYYWRHYSLLLRAINNSGMFSLPDCTARGRNKKLWSDKFLSKFGKWILGRWLNHSFLTQYLVIGNLLIFWL